MRLAAMCLVAAAAMHVRAAVIHVSPYGAHIQPFSTWSTAATSVPAAVALARQGDEVLVSNGYYTLESTVLVTNAIFLHSIAGRDETVLDGDFSRRCIRLAAPGAVVEGFTLWLGYVEGTWPAGAGGAALVEAGTLRSCSVTDSDARFGGGVACVAGMVTNCIIEGNAAEVEGGGVYMRGGQIEACVISLNSADEAYGGGVFCDGAGNLVRCVIADNSAVLSGGGVYCNEGGFMASCLVTGNDADYGGGINCYRGGRVVNCTVTDNEAYERGGGIRCVQGGTVYNSIIYANIPANVAVTAGGALFGYSCIVPLEAGQGNIAALPLFTNAASGDYSLSELSPCIDAGTNLAELAGTLDLAGMPRIFGARADMGAYEWVPEPCVAAAWLCACMMAWIRRRRGTAAVAAMASVFLCCHGAHADMPRFEVDASTSGERYYPDIHDNTAVWWEGGNGGQFVWHDWIADEEDVSPAVSPQPLRARMYKRAITWSDEFSADPDIWLAMLFEDPEENPVEVIIEQPEDGTIVTGGFVSMSGLANSLAGELVAVQWELLTAAEEVLDAGPATGLAQWHCTVYLAPSDESYKVRIRAIDAIGNNGEEVVSLSATGQTVRAYAVRAAVADDAGAFAVCAAPGAQLNPDIDGVDVVWEDRRDGQADIYHFCRTNMVTVRLTSLPGNERQPAVWGGLVAWVDNRNGNDDIYACWLTGGTAFAVCTNEAAQARPDVCAGLIAWEEYRNGNSDIFAFDLSNQVEFCITSNIWPQFRPRVSDAWAVWEDWRSDTGDADIMAWDRAEQAEHTVSTAERNQNAPSVYRDRFAWMSDEDEEWAIYAAFPADAFSINNGGTLTKTPFVTLAFATAYPLRNSMSVVNDVPGGSVYSGDFVTGMVWRLPERDGLRTVTVEYEYPDGSATDELEAEITLDQNPPRPGRISIDPSPIVGNAATITIGFVELGAGINYAVSPAVMLRPVTGTAEIVRQILYEDDTWMGIWSTTGSYRGRAILSVRGARDNAGFEMAPEEFAATVTIGSYFPDAHVTLNEGAAV
ncbi:hypothetical protein GX586_12375, partial [bacterium]|nr:hypothetical protein [bacterium]